MILKDGKISVLLVGDFPLVRLGLATLLRGHPVFDVCGDVEAGPQSLSQCERLEPHCLVLDLESETLGDAWQLLKDLRRLRPELRIVAISDREDVETLQRTFRAGARGYVSKRDEPAVVLRALDWLCQTGERFLGDCVKERVLDDVAAERVRLRETGVDALSERERVVFRLIGAKEGPTRISQLLGVSVKTVESHQERIKVKLGVTGLTELKRRAVEWSLVGPKRQMESKG